MSIYQSTLNCNTAFANYSAAELHKGENSPFQKLQGRFDVWRDYSGATARDGVRLDNRLSDFPQVVEVIVELLEIVSQGLDDARVTRTTQSTSAYKDVVLAASTSHGNTDVPGQQKPWDDILSAVNELMKLTTMIRKSSSSNPRYQNAYPAPEGEDARFELYCPILVRREFPDARTSLTKLLSDAVIQRRRRLIRQRRRQFEQSAPEEVTHQINEMSLLSHHEDIQGGGATAMPDLGRHQPQNDSSASVVSKPGPSITHRFRSTVQPAESIIGTSRSAAEPALYPPLPQPDSKNPDSAICPYCSEPLTLPLPAQAWKNHIDKDLQIYVCLSETCAANLKFFDSSTNWNDHMVVHHHPDWPQKIHLGVWYCDLGHPKEAVFTNVEGFRAHYETEHPEIYGSDRQMKTHIRRDRKPGQRDEHFCPLCETQYDGRSTFLSRSGLLEHVREHLRCLAMFSLPFVESSDTSDPASDSQLALPSIFDDDGDPNQENGSKFSFVSSTETQSLSESAISLPASADDNTGGLLRQQLEEMMVPLTNKEDTIISHLRTHRPASPEPEEVVPKTRPPESSQRNRPIGVTSVARVVYIHPRRGKELFLPPTQVDLPPGEGRSHDRLKRYVIINTGPPEDPHPIALPIENYGGRGVAVPGVIKAHHCIIFSSAQPPVPKESERPRRGEESMRLPPIRVVLNNPSDHLDPTSRVHLMGAKAINTGDSIKEVGRVSRESEQNLVQHFWAVWGRGRSLPPDRGIDNEDDEKDTESDEIESDSADDQEPAMPQNTDTNKPKVTPTENPTMHALAVNGDTNAMRALLAQKPDVNARDREGWTPLQRAAYAGQALISQMLLHAGADINYSSGYFDNALQCAAHQGHNMIVRLLISRGAYVNQQGGHHGNALMAAACQGHETTVEILLQAGASVNSRSRRHASAIDGATHHGHTRIARILEQRTGKAPMRQNVAEASTTPKSSLLGRQSVQPPWQHSSALGGEFVWRSQTDEIVLKTGQWYARPSHIPIRSLQQARYDGPIPFGYYGEPQAQPIPHRQVQTIRQGTVNVIFQSPTPAQIARREPAWQMDHLGKRVPIDNPSILGKLFPSFRVRHDAKAYFRIGKVFSLLWSETEAVDSTASHWEPGMPINVSGDRAFSKVRRFVVVREGGISCHALPITTYGGLGVAKRSVVKADHVIVYSSQVAPSPTLNERPRRSESGMRPVPIRVERDSISSALDPMSRLNLGGLTLVQHNVKVQSFGKVSETSIRDLRQQFNIVWGPHIPAPQTTVGPVIDEESDDADDDDVSGSEESSDHDEGEQQQNARLAQPMGDGPRSGAALLHRDTTSQDAGSATAMEKVRAKPDASSSRRDGTSQLQVSASRGQLDRIYHDHLRNMEVMQNSSGSTDTPPSIRAEMLKPPEPDMRAPAHGLVMDNIFSYRLSRTIVEGELLKMFPKLSNAALQVKQEDDVFTFRVPRMLTFEQKQQILSQRLEDRSSY